MNRQKTELLKLSQVRVLETLTADVKLAGTRLEFLMEDRLRRLSAIAAQAETLKAMESRNDVAMSELLGPVAQSADVDAIIVLDDEARVIGASSYTADIVSLGSRIPKFSFYEDIKRSLADSLPDGRIVFSRILPYDDTKELVPSPKANAIQQLIFVPVLDDFGYVAGGLLAQRWIRKNEGLLVDLAITNSFGLVLVYDGQVISRANFEGTFADLKRSEFERNITSDDRHVIKCGHPLAPVTICALLPIEELTATQNELTRIGVEEEAKLLQSLFLFGLLTLVVFATVSFLLSRQITLPLTKITKVLSSITAGDYEREVAGINRHDEVGDIARSVVSLQRSVKERDALRLRVNEKNSILKLQETRLREQNMLFDAALNNMSHGLCMFDTEGKLIVSNHRFVELFELEPGSIAAGMSAEQIATLKAAEIVEQDSVGLGQNALRHGELTAGMQSTEMVRIGSGRIVLTTRQPLADGGRVEISEDITFRQEARDRLAFLARHDVLTKLPNRIEFREQLEALICRQRESGGAFAVLCLDLDEFKTVNDSLGHPIGDALLREVAGRLSALTSREELVVRLGGDEFAILSELPADVDALDDLAQQVIIELSQTFNIAEHEIVIGVSIGISVASGSEVSADELFKQADLALYEAKADGRNTYRFFETQMGTAVNMRRELIAELRNAVSKNELEVHCQPQFSLSDYRLTGTEALLRWKHPERGMVSPAEFIPLAEDTGIIVPLGEWVLREACRIAAQWPGDLRIAVNLSPRQLRARAFGPVLINTLATSGLSAHRLELEVTETVLLLDADEVLDALHQAKSLGVKVSLDDFGTGYSSLSYLRRFPFDKIKIDQSFISSMTYDEDSAAIVKSVIEMANNLNMTTTAEGIETEQQLTMLSEMGCTEAQGYLLGRPAPVSEIERLIDETQNTPLAAAF